jgi:serine protease Do
MKPLLYTCAAAVALVGAAALAYVLARPVHGQAPPDRRWLQELTLLQGPGSHIGVSARDLDAAEAERLKLSGGVFIDSVRPDSPAASAGLRASDVVVEFDGERVRSVRQFTRLVRETPPDRPVRAAVMRDGKRTELSVTPAAGAQDFTFNFPELRDRIPELRDRLPELRDRLDGLRERMPFEFDFDMRLAPRDGRLGVSVQEITPDLAAYFGASDGVLVASVTPDSAAARAGVKAGDVITAVNGRDVTSGSDLVRELRAISGDGTVTLGIVRDKKATSLTAQIQTETERRARPSRPAWRGRPIGATAAI